MTQQVYKYVVTPAIEIPEGGEILSVHAQEDAVFLWVKVDPDAPTELRRFHLYGTGHDINTYEPLEYIGTAHLDNGLVVHAFEEVSR